MRVTLIYSINFEFSSIYNKCLDLSYILPQLIFHLLHVNLDLINVPLDLINVPLDLINILLDTNNILRPIYLELLALNLSPLSNLT